MAITNEAWQLIAQTRQREKSVAQQFPAVSGIACFFTRLAFLMESQSLLLITEFWRGETIVINRYQ